MQNKQSIYFFLKKIDINIIKVFFNYLLYEQFLHYTQLSANIPLGQSH
jgi:hypothetical protein